MSEVGPTFRRMPTPDGLSERPRHSLSPSRAVDFQACPLLYRFRAIDRLPEPPSLAALRGTLVHAVLEQVYDLPRERRTLEEAVRLIAPRWERMVAEDPSAAEAVAGEAADVAQFLAGAGDLVEAYFSLEDPGSLQPAARELPVEAALESGLVLRGFVDRLDRSADGALRVVDYKTGRPPAVGYEARPMFQMRFYALVLWRMRGQVPALLQLMYLSTGVVLHYAPDEADLLATQRKVEALWLAIRRAEQTADFRPNPSALCRWCAHQSLCPAFGGTPPPMPVTSLDDPAS